MRLSEQADHRAVVNPIILQAISGTTAPTPVNASNYRETDYVYDKDNRLTSTSVLGVTTGSWTSAGGWTADTTTTVSTSNLYDADGNLIRQTDGNGNNTYTWYDALGRKVAEADAGKYLTAYTSMPRAMCFCKRNTPTRTRERSRRVARRPRRLPAMTARRPTPTITTASGSARRGRTSPITITTRSIRRPRRRPRREMSPSTSPITAWAR